MIERKSMQTTKLYVEFIIIGMETLVWIMLLILLILGKSVLWFFDYCIQNFLTSIFMIGTCYILGLLTDRVADELADKKKNEIKREFPIEASTSLLVWEKVKQDTFAAFTLSRIRILRSTALNFSLMGIVGMLVCFFTYHRLMIGGLSLIFFESIAFISWRSHTNLLVNYYRKTKNLEFDTKNQKKAVLEQSRDNDL